MFLIFVIVNTLIMLRLFFEQARGRPVWCSLLYNISRLEVGSTELLE